jgi:hypothetical protein
MIECVISGFRYEVDEIFSLLGYFMVYSDKSLPVFWDQLFVPKGQKGITTICCVMTQKSAYLKMFEVRCCKEGVEVQLEKYKYKVHPI